MITLYEYKEIRNNLDALLNAKIDKLDFYNSIEECFYHLENKNFQCKKSENNGYNFIAYDPHTPDGLQVTFITESDTNYITVLDYCFHNLDVKTYGVELRPPEFTESPLTYDIDLFGFEIYEGFTLFGNDNYYSGGAEIEFIKNFDSFYSDLSYFYEGGRSEFESVDDLYIYHFDSVPTRSQKKAAWYILKDYERYTTAELFPEILSILKNKRYNLATLRGYCQGDWVHCLYPSKNEGLIEQLEIEYFNTGSEWIVTEPTGNTFTVYTRCDDKKELAEQLRTTIDNIYFKEVN